MQYDINKYPLELIIRAKEQLKNHDLNKALKTIEKGNIKLIDIKDDLESCINWLYLHKSYGVILSAYYKFGNCSNYTINELLRKMYEAKDIPSFLKQAYRFDVYKGFENEIEYSIKWHEDKKLPDAYAWRNKFKKLSEINQFNEAKNESLESISIQEEVDEKFNEIPKVLKIKPIKQIKEKISYELEIEPENDPYIISKIARIKLENANNLHSFTNKTLRKYLELKNFKVMESKLIDTFTILSNGPAIFEIKSITEANEREQIRHAISQLYEYRFLHSLPNASLWIVFSQKPFSPAFAS